MAGNWGYKCACGQDGWVKVDDKFLCYCCYQDLRAERGDISEWRAELNKREYKKCFERSHNGNEKIQETGSNI